MLYLKKLLIFAIFFVPLTAIASEEQTYGNPFQQYEQKVVKSTVNNYDYDDYLNYMMFPYVINRYGGYFGGRYHSHHHNWHNSDYYSSHNSFTYYGPSFWDKYTVPNENSNETTLVPETEYSFQFSEKQDKN